MNDTAGSCCTPKCSGWPGKAIIILMLAAGISGAFYLKSTQGAGEIAQGMAGPATAANPARATSGLPKLLDLGADKCVPCKMMVPVLESLKKEQAGKLDVEFIDVWKDPEAAKPHNINLIPCQIFFDASGKELFRHEGFFSKEDILAKWKELGVDLAAAASAPASSTEPATK